MADNQNKQPLEGKALNELLKVRREKLANLQEMDRDPFKIVKADVKEHSMQIKDNYEEFEGKEVAIG